MLKSPLTSVLNVTIDLIQFTPIVREIVTEAEAVSPEKYGNQMTICHHILV